MTSCGKNRSDGSTSFVNDVRNHIDEFLHASMEEHRTCFKKTMQKMLAQAVGHRTKEAQEIESSLPLQTTVRRT